MDTVAKQAANAELARMLGWTDIEPEANWVDDEDGYRSWTGWRGTSPGGVNLWLPDWYDSVDAALAIIPDGYGVSFHGRMAHILSPDASKRWDGEGDTRAERLGNARLAMAQAQQEGAS